MSAHWPLTLYSQEIRLQPLHLRDRSRWYSVRLENKEWLSPWEATLPQVNHESPESALPSFWQMLRSHNREARSGRSFAFMMWNGNNLIGQITMGGVIYGAFRCAHIGYWIDKAYANRGFTTQAVELMTAFGFGELGLHRLEISMRPENTASIKVAEKSGYIFEGVRPRYLHIDGAWRDHLCYVKENPAVN